MSLTASKTNDDALMDEILAFAQQDRNDLAIRLLEINAQRNDGELSDEEFDEARASLYA